MFNLRSFRELKKFKLIHDHISYLTENNQTQKKLILLKNMRGLNNFKHI